MARADEAPVVGRRVQYQYTHVVLQSELGVQEPPRLRPLDPSEIDGARLDEALRDAAIAAYEAVVGSERRRRDYRDRLERRGRVGRALPTPAVDAGGRRHRPRG